MSEMSAWETTTRRSNPQIYAGLLAARCLGLLFLPVFVAPDLSWCNGVQMIWKKMMTIATQLTKNAAVRRYGTPAMCTIA